MSDKDLSVVERSHIWKDGKWIEVDKSSIAEHQHNGKPEDCDRCNAMLYFDLTRLSNAKLRTWQSETFPRS
jgi:predicted PP-loop superfamily ATPase